MNAVIILIIGLLAILGELFLPSGVMGIIGIGMVVFGILLLMGVSMEIAAAAGIIASLATAVIVYAYWKHLNKKPIKTGGESFIGLTAIVLENFKNGRGQVRVKGEDWSARSKDERDYKKGEKAKIIDFEGVYLEVS